MSPTGLQNTGKGNPLTPRSDPEGEAFWGEGSTKLREKGCHWWWNLLSTTRGNNSMVWHRLKARQLDRKPQSYLGSSFSHLYFSASPHNLRVSPFAGGSRKLIISEKMWTFHELAGHPCHPCVGAMLISLSWEIGHL